MHKRACLFERRQGGSILQRGNVSIRQFTILSALFVIGDTILYVPANVTRFAMRDAWISGAIAMILGLCIAVLFGYVVKQYPGKSLIEITRESLGNWTGAAVSILLILFFLIDSGIVLWEVGDFMVTHIMPETPIQAFQIMFLLVVVWGFRLGIDTVVRASELLFFCVVVLFFLLVFLLIPQMELKRLLPVYQPSPKPVLSGALLLSGYYFESVILIMVMPAIRGRRGIVRSYLLGTAVGGLILTLTILVCILVLGAPLTEMQLFTTYVLAKKISIGGFLERIEVAMASLWLFTLYFKLYVCYYAVVAGTSQLFAIKDNRVLSLPLAVVVLVTSLVVIPNIAYFNLIVVKYWWAYTATFGLLLPLLILGFGGFKKRRLNQN
ncbi:GerAB/ArcD/ProY family transporter [Paenibacillus ginsengarvi]|uniref:Spore gernimation protein n=1 Tax=Paenibacillus ginsengarvi TaxID=400777 RepID=A0A3B0CNP6_9BACL|nr:endospore germination permease [Paenibacillus ginsengarvi]RKN86084.1 spore gernimation protein [Paenibacillus ginsengarvi]